MLLKDCAVRGSDLALRERLRVCTPVRSRVILVDNTEPIQPAQDDVETAVVQLLAVGDEAAAADAEYGWLALVVGLPAVAQQCHADQPIGCQGVGDHFPVPRLEDVQRQEYSRKE